MSTAVSTEPPSPPLDAEWRRLFLLVRLSARRSLKARYRGSSFGVLWSFANPLIMTALYTAIFGTAFARYYDGSIVRYLCSVFVGLVVATFFINGTSEALVTVVQNGHLLNKVAVPPAIFPLASVAANIFQQLVTTFPVLFVVSIVVTHDPRRALLVPFVLLGLTLLTAGVSLGLSALYVFFRDLQYLWSIAGFMLWMTSPMFYPEAVVPEHVRVWFRVNPIAQQMTAIREVTLAHGSIRFDAVAIALAVGAVAFVLGAALFRATRRDFMDLV